MIRYGAILIKDSRASETVNSTFLDTLEDYFAQSEAEIVKDTRPEVHFQVGATLENTEQVHTTIPHRNPTDLSVL